MGYEINFNAAEVPAAPSASQGYTPPPALALEVLGHQVEVKEPYVGGAVSIAPDPAGIPPLEYFLRQVTEDHPDLPFKATTQEEVAFIERARKLIADRMRTEFIRQRDIAVKTPPKYRDTPAALPLPPASDRDTLLQAALKAVTALATAGGSQDMRSVPDSMLKGAILNICVDSLEERERMAPLAAVLRSAGAKVGFRIGAEEASANYSTKTKNACKVPSRLIPILRGPIVRMLKTGPKTMKQIEDMMRQGNYDGATYFNINQILHSLGCIKKEGERQPGDRGPRYVWTLPEGVEE